MPNEEQAGDQRVHEGEVVDRLQEVDLHDVDQSVGLGDHRRDDQRADLAGLQEHHAGVDRHHAKSHRDHDEGLKRALETEIGEHEAQRDEPDAGESDHGILDEERPDAGKDRKELV